MASAIAVRDSGSATHNTNEYILLDIRLPGTDARIAHIIREVYIVEELRARVLIRVDILGPEGITPDMITK